MTNDNDGLLLPSEESNSNLQDPENSKAAEANDYDVAPGQIGSAAGKNAEDSAAAVTGDDPDEPFMPEKSENLQEEGSQRWDDTKGASKPAETYAGNENNSSNETTHVLPFQSAEAQQLSAAERVGLMAAAMAANEMEAAGIIIWEPADADVLSGRGASVNAHPGNKKFRALCFAHKSLFDAGNHAAKRRVGTQIVDTMMNETGTRFLKRTDAKGPWHVLTREQAILKAQQIMRDYRRPDRLAHRELLVQSGKKRNRATATPLDDVEILEPPEEPLIETPEGIHEHDVLSGRGAFVNGHVGNSRLRQLAAERKAAFDAGGYQEKRALAMEIVAAIHALDPPGRFLKKIDKTNATAKSDKGNPASTAGIVIETPEGAWREVSQEQAIHKSCQVCRDIARPDRRERDEQRRIKKLRKEGKLPPEDPNKGMSVSIFMPRVNHSDKDGSHGASEEDGTHGATTISMSNAATLEAETSSAAVEAAMAAAVDKALNGPDDDEEMFV